jgi:type I restriction enzyme S subunit
MKNGWQTKTLGDVLGVQNGYAFDSEFFNSSKGVPLVRIRSLKAGTETETRFSGVYDKKYLVKAGDLLIGMDGEFGCYEWKGSPALLNQRVCRLQEFASNVVPRFVFYGVNSYLKAIEDVTGYATVKHLSSKQILGIKFPVPPRSEQQRIVGILDEAFEGIATAKANAEKNLQNARALFESHLQSVFTQRGEGWVEKTIQELCKIGDGNHGEKYPKKSDMVPSGIPFIRGTNLVDGKISGEDILFISPEKNRILKKGHLKTGDVLFTNRGEIGKVAIVEEAFDGANLNSQIAWLRCREALLHEYLFFFLQSPQLKRHFAQTQSGAALQQFTIKMLSAVVVAHPTLSVQQRMVAQFEKTSAETQRLESIYQKKLATLEALKKSLLHQAFTGQL